LFFQLQMPPTLGAAAAWLVAMVFAVLLGSAITNLLNISLLWTLSGEGIGTLLNAATWLLSGITLPLLFFPDWTQSLINALPFRYIMDVPFRFYLGQIPAEDLWHHLPFQVGWLLSLMGAGRFLVSRATHRLVVQGG
ncbi:MAG: ABC-2 type transporter, partial [bacterium]|nr:ABC-2 type transporter [bacterium]